MRIFAEVKITRSNLVWAASVLLVLYTLFGFLLAPYLMERYLPRYAQQWLGQRATVTDVRINPFLLTLDVSGFALHGSTNAETMLTFKRLFADFELSSIVRRAWTFSDLRLERPDLRLNIDSEGRLNVMRVIERLRGHESEGGDFPRLVFEHLSVAEGRIGFIDLSGRKPATVSLDTINLEAARIGTLPDRRGRYSISANLAGGGSLAWEGSASLEPVQSSGQISIRGFKLATAWQFLRDEFTVAEPAGELVLAARYDFAYAHDEPEVTVSGVQAEISGLVLAPLAQGPALLALRTIRIGDARFALADREVVVPSLQLSTGELRASVSADGGMDWQNLMLQQPSTQKQPTDAQPWRVHVEHIQFEKVALFYTDRSTTPGIVARAATLNGGLMLDVTAGARAPDLLAADIQIELIGTALSTVQSETPLAVLDSLVLTGGRVDTRARTIRTQAIALSGGGVKIAGGPTGPTGLLRALASARSPLAAPAADRSDSTGAEPWTYRVGAVGLKGFNVSLADQSFEPVVEYDIEIVSAELTDIDSASSVPIAFDTELRFGKQGRVEGNGMLQQDFAGARANVSIKAIALEPLSPVLERYARIDLKSGRVAAANGELTYERKPGKPPSFGATGLQVEISGLALTASGDARTSLALGNVRIGNASFTAAERELTLQALMISDGHVRTSLPVDGALGSQHTPPAPDANGGDAQPWHIRMERLGIEKVALTYADRSTLPGLVVRAAALNGSAMLDVLAGAGSAQVVVEDARLALEDAVLAAPKADVPLATLDAVVLMAGRIDTQARSVGAQSIEINGGRVTFARGSDAPTGLLQALLPLTRGPAEASAPSAPRRSEGDSTWRYRIDTVAVKHLEVGLADYGFDPAITYNVDVSAGLAHIDSKSGKPISFDAELRLGEGGTLTSAGTLRQDFGQARAELIAKGVALVPLQPLLARYARVELQSGKLAASVHLDYRPDAHTALTASGAASVHDFLLNEADTGDRLLAWSTLAADNFVLGVSPNRLTIEEVRVLQPGSKIVIAQDRSVNLTQVMRSNNRQPTAAAVSETSSEMGGSLRFPVEIGRIRLENGTLDFADLSLVLPFSTQVQTLQGSIVGVSSAPQSRAELALRGRIERYGEARAKGSLMPWRPTEYLDIEAQFENVGMPGLSPYSATFAGRKVASGRLWLDLHYKIVNGELAGENKVAFQDLKLGERVEAPNALDLPLDLAIALLTDSQGRIDLAVPVTGDVDNPRFDYGKVIRAAVGSAIRRVVTAPFRMLAGLFGNRDAEEFGKVEFAPGSDRIAPAQRERLDKLAEALKQRPQVKLVVRGPYDPQRDAQQLSRELARGELARSMGVKLGSDDDSDPIAYGDPRTQQALERLLAERAGADVLHTLAREMGGRRDQSEAPRDANGERAFYGAVFERLVELQPQLAAAPRVLAAKRARAIIDALLNAGVPPNRLESGELTQVVGAETAIASEFALGVMPGAS